MSESKAALSAFREEVAAWMAENVPADPGFLLPLTFLEVGTEQQLPTPIWGIRGIRRIAGRVPNGLILCAGVYLRALDLPGTGQEA